MSFCRRISTAALGLLVLVASMQSGAEAVEDTVVTLLFTNDIESAYESVPAWWLDDLERIGGIAELSTLIREQRRNEPNVFLFDAGDIFTGALSRLTDGALMFEFRTSMYSMSLYQASSHKAVITLICFSRPSSCVSSRRCLIS